MDNEKWKKLRDMVEKGELSEELFKEIVGRWEAPENELNERPERESKKDSKSDRSKKIHVSGSSRMTSIYAEDVSISGSLTVEGNVDAVDIDISGSCKIGNDLVSSNTIDSSGSVNIGGDLKGREIDSSGSFKVQGKIEANEIDSSGLVKADSLVCESLDSSGFTKIENEINAKFIDTSGKIVAKSIECETMDCSGSIGVETVKGDEIFIKGKIESNYVKAKRFEMELNNYPKTLIKKLEADFIQISLIRKRFFSTEAEIDEIICNKAYLEHVKSKRISGSEIEIGDGSVIDYVEAKVIKISENAIVKDKKIID